MMKRILLRISQQPAGLPTSRRSYCTLIFRTLNPDSSVFCLHPHFLVGPLFSVNQCSVKITDWYRNYANDRPKGAQGLQKILLCKYYLCHQENNVSSLDKVSISLCDRHPRGAPVTQSILS